MFMMTWNLEQLMTSQPYLTVSQPGEAAETTEL